MQSLIVPTLHMPGYLVSMAGKLRASERAHGNVSAAVRYGGRDSRRPGRARGSGGGLFCRIKRIKGGKRLFANP
jgi:hypothetical protein